VIGTLAVDGWTITFGTARWAPPSPLIAVPNVTAHPSTASVLTSYYSMCQLPLHSKELNPIIRYHTGYRGVKTLVGSDHRIM